MAHEITTHADGTAEAAFALTPAWHGLGEVITDPDKLTSEEFFTAAKLNWMVEQRRVWYGCDLATAREDKRCLANVRGDNGHLLGYVSPSYKVVQNFEAFKFLDALHEDKELMYESAFSLQGGRYVVVTARLPQEDEVVPGDKLQRYVLMFLCHDGTSAIQFGVTSVRVVCQNTYNLAKQQDGRSIKDLTIRHTGNIQDSLDRAREILLIANEKFDVYTKKAKEFVDFKMDGEMWDKFLDVMCPMIPKEDPDWTPARAARIAATRNAIEACYRGPRCTLPGMAGTAWAAFNAVTEHIDHLPRRGATKVQKAEARFNVTQYGPGRDQKERALRALERLMELAV